MIGVCGRREGVCVGRGWEEGGCVCWEGVGGGREEQVTKYSVVLDRVTNFHGMPLAVNCYSTDARAQCMEGRETNGRKIPSLHGMYFSSTTKCLTD